LVIPNAYLDNILCKKEPIHGSIANYLRSLFISERDNDQQFKKFIEEKLGLIYLNDRKIFEFNLKEKFNFKSNENISIEMDQHSLYLPFIYLYSEINRNYFRKF
jgi:hypothetical protein